MGKIAIIGSAGMLGKALTEVVAKEFPEEELLLLDVNELDITGDMSKIEKVLAGTSAIFNCAAYTQVDKAEEESELARAVNATGAGNLARAAKTLGAKLIHISTDFIFDGNFTAPIQVDENKNPLSIYGATKAEGEDLVIASGCDYIIARTSWLYGPWGKNFVDAIYNKASKGENLRVVCDQIGRPTYTFDLAGILVALYKKNVSGIYHCSNNGVATWQQFACEIVKLSGLSVEVAPILTEEYPVPATRPKYSVLDISETENTVDFKIRCWQDALAEYLNKYKN